MVALVEQGGPYWSLATKFDELANYMQAHDQPGPMFTRYVDKPTVAPKDGPRTEIGFVLTGQFSPGPPYRTEAWPARLVATTTTEGTFTSPSRYYAILNTWAEAHGYIAVGPMVEFYPLVSDSDSAARAFDLQLPVQKVEATLSTKNSGGTDRTPARSPASPPPADVEGKSEASLAAPPDDDDPAAPAIPEQQPDKKSSETQSPHESPATSVNLPTPVAGRAVAAPIAVLFAEQEFDQVAFRLMPAERPVPGDKQVWLGQVVYRIKAIARGIHSDGAAQAERLGALAAAMERRYKTVSSEFTGDPLAGPVVSAGRVGDPDAERQRAIMRDLDALLGRIAVGGIQPDEVSKELTELIERVDELLHPSR